MRKVAMNLFLAFATVCTWTGGLNAQTFTVGFNVPFTFHAANHQMGPGEYLVSQPDTIYAQTIRPAGSGPMFFLTSGGMHLNDSRNQSRLVFHKYGDNYYLAQIWNGAGRGTNLPVSKEEKAARENIAQTTPKDVVILASLR